MGLLHPIDGQRPFHLLVLVLILLNSSQFKLLVEGRSVSRLLKSADGRGEQKLTVRALIGSRPPLCERRCMTCGHCEAVQVPVIPQERNPTRQFWGIATLRGDYSSNYKPLSWKCKCGNRIFNP
ncbi:EPIDERMAL PATTERNING FACTOR-like protein [Musa troglodytarum]|uniref:Epidermal patterning factor-like protein n=1 Tax=Musa troglodytarum TaxID=320322 RepID=A0A9E7GRT9_9LILI|nr:EPIDERMAL PATTERNING FACTOR-like protein [Musa troglodytarum]